MSNYKLLSGEDGCCAYLLPQGQQFESLHTLFLNKNKKVL